jgi:hypothetical protein
LGFTTSYGNLSQKAKDLIFDWNFFSEEFKEYCHRGYDDTFLVTITDKKTETEKQLFRTSVDTLCGACNGSDVNSSARQSFSTIFGLRRIENRRKRGDRLSGHEQRAC